MTSDPSGRYGPHGHIHIIGAERRLLVGGQPVALGSRAFDLLAALVVRRDRLVPKDELIDTVWPGLVVEDNNLQVQISALRKVLGAAAITTAAGRGYRFTADAISSPPPRPAPAGTAATPSPAPARLLVADDNKVNRLLLCRTLTLMGHAVDSATDGLQALDKLRGGQPPDLLLLDLQMPGLDGYALLEQRAADGALGEVPVIVTSSVDGVAAMARCIELGADDFLHKPVDPVLLKARVDSSLERKRLRDEQRALLARLAPAGHDTVLASLAAVDGRHLQAAVLAVRLAGIGVLAAPGPRPAGDRLDWLGSWATLMLDAVVAHRGFLARHAGDALVAVFDDGAGDGTLSAVQAAREMLASSAQLDAERSYGDGTLAVAIGIACGSVLRGSIGATASTGAGPGALVCVGEAVQRALALQDLAAVPGAPAVLLDGDAGSALAGREVTDAVADGVVALRLD